MLGGALMKRLYELHGQGLSIRRIAADLGIARNTVRTYLRAEGVPKAKPRPKRESQLDPHAPQIDERLAAGVTNCVVLLRELRGRGYAGSYALLTAYVRPRRRPRQPKATVRFETEPGQQAQVDFGQCRYFRLIVQVGEPAEAAGPGRLRPVPLRGRRRDDQAGLGLRHGAQLVAGDLSGVRGTG
jgi:hypothetical protein